VQKTRSRLRQPVENHESLWQPAKDWSSNLVGSADEIQVVLEQELRHDFGTKGEGDASVVLPPVVNPLLRITPHQITEQT
jgi:hypothetical protein